MDDVWPRSRSRASSGEKGRGLDSSRRPYYERALSAIREHTGRQLLDPPEKLIAIARGVDGACSDFVEASVSESHRAGKARGELTHVSAGRGLCESIKL